MAEKKEVKVLIEAGKATPAPPLGPTLAPLKVNIGQLISEINEKTRHLAGMQVPVTILVDAKTKKWEIEIGTPPAAALIRKEIGAEKGAGLAGLIRIGDLSTEQAKKISMMKFGSDEEPYVKQIVGTARSMGVTVGKGAITEAESKQYEQIIKAKEAEKEAKKAAAATKAATTAAPAAAA
ncbi:MAG: 50S ribosomal protein L11 [Candidatus Aenigmarchaeota archaeon]|nr:50S ribosomal protein L11 [Candidatus Aenigmarchaeota archaeon]